MSSRKTAIAQIAKVKPLNTNVDYTKEKIDEVFGKYVFSERVMQERLPKKVFSQMRKTLCGGQPLDPAIADIVANAMKDWAIENGATHYAHWFQPMTGLTAQKHDAFVEPTSDGMAICEFTGKMLIKGEPDASSFPSGGLRSTFEARGYTVWDPTSPAFLSENANGKTLTIPTAFCSYTGEVLDRKTPLLRSIELLAKQVARILRLFGNNAANIITTMGPEQEYFLIDKELYLQRPDLINAGRTLYGTKPPKGQELSDQYFGSIRPRVLAFMMDAEKRMFKLGIPVKTRHNEVAPAQFEIAPLFEAANVATDHNMLVMEVLRETADDHGLACLLHEKPFSGINGSGKHNNWSIAADGQNLLEPGDTPHDNAQFLVFLAGVLRAVHQNATILRIAVASAGNDHRLGAHEASPAIISAFLGDQLTEVIENIISGKKRSGKNATTMEVGVTALPHLPKDATDRNRTSPFAFTGNKFEFRAVGSAQSIAPANMALNTIVAQSLNEIATRLEKDIKAGKDFNASVQALLQDLFTEHKAIIFNGNGYSEEWQKEAEKRGLPNLTNSVDALEKFTDSKIVKVFEKVGVFNAREIEARREILLENYTTTVSIEALLAVDMGRTIILPAAIKYQTELALSLNAVKAALGEKADVTAQKELLDTVTRLVTDLKKNLSALDAARSEIEATDSSALNKAKLYRDKVLPLMKAARKAADELETIVDDAIWPLPKYREMLFVY